MHKVGVMFYILISKIQKIIILFKKKNLYQYTELYKGWNIYFI